MLNNDWSRFTTSHAISHINQESHSCAFVLCPVDTLEIFQEFVVTVFECANQKILLFLREAKLRHSILTTLQSCFGFRLWRDRSLVLWRGFLRRLWLWLLSCLSDN